MMNYSCPACNVFMLLKRDYAKGGGTHYYECHKYHSSVILNNNYIIGYLLSNTNSKYVLSSYKEHTILRCKSTYDIVYEQNEFHPLIWDTKIKENLDKIITKIINRLILK